MPLAQAQKPEATSKPITYNRLKLAQARLVQPYALEIVQMRAAIDQMGRELIGQENAIQAFAEKATSYYENLDNPKRTIPSANFIGLPGTGKSTIAQVLKQYGFPVEVLDAREFAGEKIQISLDNPVIAPSTLRLDEIMDKHEGQPLFLFVDHLDELPDAGGVPRPLIAALNEIKSSGKLSFETVKTDFSKVFLITAMNLSLSTIRRAVPSLAKTGKTFYDLSFADLANLDRQVTSSPKFRYTILSEMFTPSTVSLLAPDTIILNSWTKESYRQLVRKSIEEAITDLTRGANSKKKLIISVTEGFIDFLMSKSVFAPSGARETISKTPELVTQLVRFASRGFIADESSLSLPRSAVFDVNTALNSAKVTVTPIQTNRGAPKYLTPFSFLAKFNPSTRLFMAPSELNLPTMMVAASEVSDTSKRLKKDIRAARFPVDPYPAKGLAQYLNKIIVGYEGFFANLETELNAYLSGGPKAKEPFYKVVGSLPGQAKSDFLQLTAKFLKLPVISINLQEFQGEDEAAESIKSHILKEYKRLDLSENPNQKFILLFEELDKVFEKNPQDGSLIVRPGIAVFKELLSSGVLAGTRYESPTDFRNAFVWANMNFADDIFGFYNDPRMTTIEDVIETWKRYSSSKQDSANLLKRIFGPDAVNRILPNFIFLNPLNRQDYQNLILTLPHRALQDLYADRNQAFAAQIEVKMSATYAQMLFDEFVIPAQSGRYTIIEGVRRVRADIEAAVRAIKPTNPLSGVPIFLELRYRPETRRVTMWSWPQSRAATQAVQLTETLIQLQYPPLAEPGRLSEKRLHTTVHEFGHAFMATRLGGRFKHVIATSPEMNIGGYVTPVTNESNDLSFASMLAELYETLAAKSFERIFFSEAPLEPDSVLKGSPGPSMDIQMSTNTIWEALFNMGYDPFGGTIDRAQASFSKLSSSATEALGLVMRDMENFIIQEALRAHPLEWYQDKIERLGHMGGASEAEFYDLIDLIHPGPDQHFLGEKSRLHALFPNSIQPLSPEIQAAMDRKQSDTQTSPIENMEIYMTAFKGFVQARLHGGDKVNFESVSASCNQKLQNGIY